MKRILILLTMSLLLTNAWSQTKEDSIKAVIDKMFLAMKNADTSALKECFSDHMLLQTISDSREGQTRVENIPASGFLGTIAKLKAGDADERIIYESIKTDEALAMVWTPYKFYYKGNFSHCGVNSFQLVRLEGGWKIQYIIDTRRQQGCE